MASSLKNQVGQLLFRGNLAPSAEALAGLVRRVRDPGGAPVQMPPRTTKQGNQVDKRQG
ncbi:hypothetical protein [Sorangium sp. So ce204]|uniref:hypothetical protein n=1 Tax=Sorangium sp. So ce204 TaxID=3133288 RepID=UPI003F61965B